MSQLKKFYLLIFFFGSLFSCTDTSYSEDAEAATDHNSENENSSGGDGCKYKDGTHAATVDYTNSKTGYNQTYTLDIIVQNCEVTQINFPNGGWLDSDHMSPAELDSDGTCTIEGEEGKTYEIQIDN